MAAAWPARLVSIAMLGSIWIVDSVAGLITCGIVAALAGFDWYRTGQLRFAIICGSTLGLAILPAGLLVGFTPTGAGVLMAAAGLVAVGLALAVPHRLDVPLGAAATVATLVGVMQASAQTSTLAPALMITGASMALVGGANRSRQLTGLGALIALCGMWMQLADWQVHWLEPYLAPPALIMLVAGFGWHRDGMSSWIAYAPTIAIFGGVALDDRLAGGSAWHAVIAGTVGVLAVIAGGAKRLVGPLITGTALVAAVVIHESLARGASVPTWGWLAMGGTVLLGAAVWMERSETSPIEHGQHVLEILQTRFS